jgi:hypothetical protein
MVRLCGGEGQPADLLVDVVELYDEPEAVDHGDVASSSRSRRDPRRVPAGGTFGADGGSFARRHSPSTPHCPIRDRPLTTI